MGKPMNFTDMLTDYLYCEASIASNPEEAQLLTTAADRIKDLTQTNKQLREKLRSQRRELRRLNTSHVDKAHRMMLKDLDVMALKQILLATGIQIVKVLPSASGSKVVLAEKAEQTPLSELEKQCRANDDEIPF